MLVRLIRALWVFGWIFGSYVTYLSVRKVFRRWKDDLPRDPAWVTRYKTRVDARNARRLLRGMLRLRGVYIKLGQILSLMGGFLPQIYAKELESLQDAVPPRPFSELRPAFARTLGKSPEELFERIDEQPLAAASLGQVHRATGKNGRELAVKILYPGIRDIIRVDMQVVRLAMRAYKLFVPIQNIERVHDALVDLLARETDYVHEGQCMTRMAANFVDEPDILFPEVVTSATSSDVLTMTFMEGFKITHFDTMKEQGVSRDAVAERLVKCFYKQLFVDRFFHADPHPGNFLVQPGPTEDTPRIVVLDFGAISEVAPSMVDGMLDILRGFFEGRDELVMQGIEEIGFVAPDGDRALLEQTVKVYFQKLLKVERTVGALTRATERELEQLANPEIARQELRRLMRSVRYPEGWFFVERANVLMFWLAGQIAPELDMLHVGMPYVLPLLAERTAQAAKAEQTKADQVATA